MTNRVLYQMPGEVDPDLPLSTLSQALTALWSGLHEDLVSPVRGALDDAECGDMPETIAAGLLAMAMEGKAFGRLLQAADDMAEHYTPGSHRYRLEPRPNLPGLVAAVRRTGRRWTMLAAGINELLVDAERDAAERERALIELQAGRARISDDGTSIVAIGARPGGRG